MKTLNQVLSALTLLFVGTANAAYPEIGSRVQGGTPATVQKPLQTLSIPVQEVRIAPSARQLEEMALESAWRLEGGEVPPMAKALGLKPPPRAAAPQRVGSVFPAPAAVVSRTQWERQSDGTFVTQLKITSQGALGIRAKLQLPDGVVMGELRAAANWRDNAESVPLYVATANEIWTPYTDGETQLVEIRTRQNVANGTVRVIDISHFEVSLNSGGGGLPNQTQVAGACSPDVVCTSENSALDTAISERRKSVARIAFRSGDGNFVCSGTLINSNSQQNFFVTANHCIATQAEASSITFRWFYEATTCGGGAASAISPPVQTLGATLVFTNQFVDSTLLRMNVSPPAGTVFAGWNAAPITVGSSVVSISHPTGDVMKFALGTNSSNNNSTGENRLSGFEQNMIAVLFSRGVIEGGSSGSGLFTLSPTGSLQLRGILSNSIKDANGNTQSCTTPNLDAGYGKWDYFQPQIAALLDGQSLPVDDHPNQPSLSATALPLNGASVAGTINYVGDLDTFRVTITEPGTLYVKSAGGYDLIANLMDSEGTTLNTNDDASTTSFDFGVEWAVQPGTYYVSVVNWTPTELTPNGYRVSAQFSTATTNYTSLWWGGEAESGWGMNLNHQGNVMFATMFNYENAGQGSQNPGMWLTAVLRRQGLTQSYDSGAGQLLRVTGPAFNATPFTPISNANATSVGRMRIDFSANNAGLLTYSVSGAGTGGTGTNVVKNISRQAFSTLPDCTFTGRDRTFSTGNFQDLWWNPNESGWGINLTHQGTTIFGTLFTFEAGAGNFNKGMWLTASMARTAANDYSGDLVRVSGSAFDAQPFMPLVPSVNATRVGNMRVQFTNGNAGTLTYDVNGVTVSKSIQRQVFDTFPSTCEAP